MRTFDKTTRQVHSYALYSIFLMHEIFYKKKIKAHWNSNRCYKKMMLICVDQTLTWIYRQTLFYRASKMLYFLQIEGLGQPCIEHDIHQH